MFLFFDVSILSHVLCACVHTSPIIVFVCLTIIYFYVHTTLRLTMLLCTYLQDSLANKVNADDLASLMPQGGSGSDDTASLMSKLLEIQNRLSQLESIPHKHNKSVKVCMSLLSVILKFF